MSNDFFGKASTHDPKGSSTVTIDAATGETQYTTALGHKTNGIHSNVAEVWQKKCTPLPAFFRQVELEDSTKYDLNVDERTVRVKHDGTVMRLAGNIIDMDGKPVESPAFTEHGFLTLMQITGSCNKTWYGVMQKTGEFDTAARIVNTELDRETAEWCEPREWQRKRKDVKDDGGRDPRQFMLRVRGTDGGQVIRSVASEDYNAELSNLMGLKLIQGGFKGQGLDEALVSHAYNDGDNILGSILIPNHLQTAKDGGDYGVGIKFKNSETKLHNLEIRPYLFRCICVNGCVWGRKDAAYSVSYKHIGNSNLAEIQDQVTGIIQIALSQGELFKSQFMMAHEVAVPEVAKVMLFLARRGQITEAQLREWYAAWKVEPENTAQGIVNGLTRAAHEKFNGHTQDAMESAAGNLLTPALDADLNALNRHWGNIIDGANALPEKKTARDLERIFDGLLVTA